MTIQGLQGTVQLNFLPVCICIFLVYFLIINHPYEKYMTERFYPVVILLFSLIVVDNLDYYYYDCGNIGVIHRIFAMFGYDIRLFLMASLLDIVVERLDLEHANYIYIPALLNLMLIMPCLFTDWVFYYTEDGVIGRGALAYVPHIVSASYIVILFVLGMMNIQRGQMNECIILVICSILSTLSVIVEMVWQLRGILVGIIAFDIVFYYMYLHVDHFKYDALTGVFNRDAFYANIEKFGKHSITAILSIDLNNLKTINDTQGHLEGDKAIKWVAKLIRKNLMRGCYLHRVGGDEFAVICTKLDYLVVKGMVTQIEKEIEKSIYKCAVGCAEWSDDRTFEETYTLADSEMYRKKKKMKEG